MEYGAEGAVTTEWDPDEIARHATRVTAIKEKLYEKAGRNITEAQTKDKEYYDKKHCDSQVRIHTCIINITFDNVFYSHAGVCERNACDDEE